MATELLRASGVSKRFGGVRAVDGMDITVRAGEVVGLIGPNGAGKSTFFDCLSGFRRPDQGEVVFEQERVDGWPMHRIARRGLVRTFQLESALERMPVMDNLLLAGAAQSGETLWGALRKKRVAAQEEALTERAQEMLAFFGLDHLASEYAGNLSGGQKKLLDLARATMLEPRMLLLDEPVAGINPVLRKQIMARIAALRDERGLTVLLVEHDMHTVFGNCDRVVVMSEGRKLAEGTGQEIRTDPRVREAYLG